MSHVPMVARVEILWSENGEVPIRTFRSLAAADAALAAAFTREVPPKEGAYHEFGFEVVWADGQRHEGRVDVTEAFLRAAVTAGGILREHLRQQATWLRDKGGAWPAWSPEERARYQAWGVELVRRLDAEPPFRATRNVNQIPGDYLVPIGTTGEDIGATLLPDPFAVVTWLEEHFAAIRPPIAVGMGTIPRTTNRDVTYAANWISLALAADMARLRQWTGRPHGALWDGWTRTIEHVRGQLGAAPDAPYRDSIRFWTEQVHRVASDIQVALDAMRRNVGPIGTRAAVDARGYA